MRKMLAVSVALAVAAGCAIDSERRERGPAGTLAYPVEIESSEPGARVEVNGDYVGKTPMTIKVFGDDDGTFHNFGSTDFVIEVFPVKPGQYPQRRVFRTGGWFSQEDQIPKRLYFDLSQKTEGFSIGPRY